jgi:hypothetical protein
MTGVGQLDGEPSPHHPAKLFQLDTANQFCPARDPLILLLNPTLTIRGVGPGLWFADHMAALTDQRIGLVQCARSSTHILE